MILLDEAETIQEEEEIVVEEETVHLKDIRTTVTIKNPARETEEDPVETRL